MRPKTDARRLPASRRSALRRENTFRSGLPQAGLALALALMFTRTFPEFGSEASALVLSVVALNELLAPAAYRYALVRSGEAGREAARTSWPEPLPRRGARA